MITVEIDEITLIELLLDRIRSWASDKITIELFRIYYMDLINSGYFEDRLLDISLLVDDDYINNTIIIDEEERNKDYSNNNILSQVQDGNVTYYLVSIA